MNLSKITGKYVGQSFEKCNCMELVYNWFNEIGITLPDSYKGLNLQNHVEKWQKDRKSTGKIMLELFKTLGKKADVNKIKRHDLLAIQEKDNVFAAIAVGTNTAITSNINIGVRVFRIGQFKKVVLARRFL